MQNVNCSTQIDWLRKYWQPRAWFVRKVLRKSCLLSKNWGRPTICSSCLVLWLVTCFPQQDFVVLSRLYEMYTGPNLKELLKAHKVANKHNITVLTRISLPAKLVPYHMYNLWLVCYSFLLSRKLISNLVCLSSSVKLDTGLKPSMVSLWLCIESIKLKQNLRGRFLRI